MSGLNETAVKVSKERQLQSSIFDKVDIVYMYSNLCFPESLNKMTYK